ncbi:MAG: general secretion pathway protein GspK [Thermodesulfobacterium sp.]|nr:general secretion pathway protein GspK [Thermodesulfobacterium sp.]
MSTPNRGSATFLMVLLVMVILTVSIGFNWLVKEYIKTAMAFEDKATAMLKARSAYDTLLYLMLNGNFGARELLLPQVEGLPALTTIPLNGTEVNLSDDITVEVQDSNGMLSLTTINTLALGRLLTYFGADQKEVDIFIDSLLDWIDPDDLTRINGAEKDWYSSQGLKYAPRNYPLQYKEEIKLIRGMKPELYEKIEPYLTMLPQTGFNPNTAKDPVLIAYLDIDNDTLKVLKEYLQTKPISSDAELYSLTGRRIVTDEGVYFFPSGYVELKIKVGKPKPFYTIKAGLYLRENLNTPYTTLYWKEE